MNRSQLVGIIAKKATLSKVQVGKVLDLVVASVQDTLKKGERVRMFGLGSFSVVKRAARKGIVPTTKKSITIPAKKVVRFKTSKTLRDIVAKSR
jgi:DNA-binding protein HU-beta